MHFFVGAIFSENNTELDERVFRFAVNSIKIPNVKLDPVVKFAATDNLFENIYRSKLKKKTIFLFSIEFVFYRVLAQDVSFKNPCNTVCTS